MIIDIDHMSRPAMRETVALSTMPVLAGHTCAKTLANRLTNYTDDEIRMVANKGGVIGLHFMTHKLTGTMRPRATMDHLMAQIDYIVEVGGIDIMALGPDYQEDLEFFNGVSGQDLSFPEEVNDTGGMLNVTRALVGHGYNDEQIKKILGGNLLRLLDEVTRGAQVPEARAGTLETA
jgi:membrane dipeptidase